MVERLPWVGIAHHKDHCDPGMSPMSFGVNTDSMGRITSKLSLFAPESLSSLFHALRPFGFITGGSSS